MCANTFAAVVLLLSPVRLFFATPWTVVNQAPLSIGLSRQEYWSGLPFPSPGDLSDSGIKTRSPALAGRFCTTESPGKCQHIPVHKFTQGGSEPSVEAYLGANFKVWVVQSNVLLNLVNI